MGAPEEQFQSDERSLTHLGPGGGSKVEKIKDAGNYLRGEIVQELEQPISHFSEAQAQLLKFHGLYQQEDRDQRQTRKAEGQEKAYQMMIRTRIPGGSLTAGQYLTLDDLSTRYGNSGIRLTTRQSMQLHGILKGNARSTIKAINETLLTTLAACGDVNRNVMACPAPTASRTHAQIQEVAQRLARHLAPRTQAYHEIWIDGEKVQESEQNEANAEIEPIYGKTYLPRKFKIGVAYPEDNCIDVYTQDVGMIARVKDEQLTGFTLIVGGGMGTTFGKAETHPLLAQPLADISVEQVVPVIETIVTVQRDYGDRANRRHARMKYVIEERGIPWFRAEVERRLGYTLNDPSPVHISEIEDHLGWQQQGDGHWYLGLHVVNGRIKDTPEHRLQSALHAVVKRFQGTINVRLTPQQNILLTDIAEEQRTPIEEILRRYNVSANPEDAGAYRFAMACPALPTCGQAMAEAERIFPGVVKLIETDLAELGLEHEPISFRMTGCPNGCARPYLGDIGFVGRSRDLYNIYLGGDAKNTRLNTLYAELVRTQDLPTVLHPLFVLWHDERLPDEGFGDYCYRVGIEALQTKAATHTNSVQARKNA